MTRASVAVDLAAAQPLRKPLFRVNILYDYGLRGGGGGVEGGSRSSRESEVV